MANSLFESLIGSMCEIKADDNTLLGFARIQSLDEDDDSRINFASAQQGERLPLLSMGTQVKVLTYGKGGGFIMLRGEVYISGERMLSLVKLYVAQEQERRRYFRINTHSPVELQRRYAAEDDFFIATLLDVSLGGIRISSPIKLRDNEPLFASFELLDTRMEFFCEIRREIPIKGDKPGETQYGCEFVEYSDRQIDRLCGLIFKMQRIDAQKRRNR